MSEIVSTKEMVQDDIFGHFMIGVLTKHWEKLGTPKEFPKEFTVSLTFNGEEVPLREYINTFASYRDDFVLRKARELLFEKFADIQNKLFDFDNDMKRLINDKFSALGLNTEDY